MSSPSDSETSASAAARIEFEQFYHNRCVTCLTYLPPDSVHCAHWFDRGDNGDLQINHAVGAGFVNKGYVWSSFNNSTIQCPTCHLSFFATKHIAYCPTREVMDYIMSLPEDDMRSIDDACLISLRRNCAIVP
ncbi:hypothetical protein A0H81_11542 [Grifola frondosa]|uniref:Uncharacterized protein n=1 Tax=Grifola frondosa TaxID=5627 RepID=A0A1C7LVC9_GRIFR|nr:hypothetical protein A0H81_11542 [Grifola frondosa]